MWRLLKQIEMEPPHDPAIPLFVIYLNELNSAYHSSVVISMFITAQFTIAKLWNQLRCLSVDEWIKTIWYMHTVELYSTIKKDGNKPFYSMWMELKNIMLSEINQTQKIKGQVLYLIL